MHPFADIIKSAVTSDFNEEIVLTFHKCKKTLDQFVLIVNETVIFGQLHKLVSVILLDFIKHIIKPAVLQIECHPYTQRQKIRKIAAKYDIKTESWFPLGGSGKGNQTLFSDPTINKIAKKHGKSPAQIILRWHIQEGFSVIPGATNPAYIKENIEIFDFELSKKRDESDACLE